MVKTMLRQRKLILELPCDGRVFSFVNFPVLTLQACIAVLVTEPKGLPVPP